MIRRTLGSLLALTALALALPQASAAQGPPGSDSATLLAEVVDARSGQPLDGVNLSIPALGIGTLTTRVGQARLAGIPPGTHTVEIRLVGYQTEEVEVEFAPLATVTMDARLEVGAVVLEGVDVVAERQQPRLADAGFYDRRRRGFGYFLEREDIEKRAVDGRISSALRVVAGMRLQPLSSRGQMGYTLVSTRAGSHCLMDVYLDGTRMSAGFEPIDIDEIVRANDVDGVEVYRGPSDIPARYRSPSANCGAVMIWTRNGR